MFTSFLKYGDVLRVFSKQCKFKTVRRILLPLNISSEGITLGTGVHWILAELHLETGKVHLYDWIEQAHDQYEIVAGWAPCNTYIPPHPTRMVLSSPIGSPNILSRAPVRET